MDLFQEKDIAVTAIFVFKFINEVVFQGKYHLIHKIFGRYIIYPYLWITFQDGMADCLGKMAFPQARICKHKKRMIRKDTPDM